MLYALLRRKFPCFFIYGFGSPTSPRRRFPKKKKQYYLKLSDLGERLLKLFQVIPPGRKIIAISHVQRCDVRMRVIELIDVDTKVVSF